MFHCVKCNVMICDFRENKMIWTKTLLPHCMSYPLNWSAINSPLNVTMILTGWNENWCYSLLMSCINITTAQVSNDGKRKQEKWLLAIVDTAWVLNQRQLLVLQIANHQVSLLPPLVIHYRIGCILSLTHC